MGSSFAYPFYDIVFTNYKNETDCRIIDNVSNTGIGFRSLFEKTVDFTGSNVYLSDEQLLSFSGEILHVPTCIGGIVLTYNVPDVFELQLSGQVIAAIFMQDITYWDDPAIQANNPGVELPHLKIKPIYRSSGSGTTYVFSDYLCRVCPKWKKEVGRGVSLNWKPGIVVDRSMMVPVIVGKEVGSIAYTSGEHADIFNLPIASVLNKSGKFIYPDNDAIRATLENLNLPDDMRISLIDSDNENAYPICCFAWILLYRNQTDAKSTRSKYKALHDLLTFMISPEQQKIAENMSYISLPEEVLVKTRKIIRSITWEIRTE